MPDRTDATGTSLTAYRLGGTSDMPLEPAPASRTWMDASNERFAFRCLPLLMANQSGWIIRNSHSILATWDGGRGKESVRIDYLRGDGSRPISSHFGHGVITWTLPYLFRTDPGWNLHMRGPANIPKDGVQALEGVIETDWSAASATMNWKLTRPGLTVRFDVGEPVCMVLPVRRDELEGVAPRIRDLADDPVLAGAHAAWATSRRQFLSDLPARGGEPRRDLWQKDYFRGTDVAGGQAPQHQRKRVLRPFDGSGAVQQPDATASR